jgi:hypothetical protein
VGEAAAAFRPPPEANRPKSLEIQAKNGVLKKSGNPARPFFDIIGGAYYVHVTTLSQGTYPLMQ